MRFITLWLLFLPLLTSCSLGYFIEQGYGQFKLLCLREQIEKVLENPDTERSLKKKINLVQEVKAFCEEMVKAGKMTPAARDILAKDFDKHDAYSDEAGFAIPFEAFKKCIETHAKVLPLGEKGQEGGEGETGQYANAAEELEAKTKKYMLEHKDVNYIEASKAVLDADKDLAKRYAME